MKNFKTRVYIMDTGTISESGLYDKLYGTVSQTRKNKIDKYKRQKDKLLSLGAGLLLKKALDDLGISAEELGYGENGKPYLKNGNIFFNLSHSGERAMCAVSANEVGCDTERIKDVDLRIAGRFFNPSECAVIDSLEGTDEKTMMFFRLWTLKESFMKATGMGMSIPLGSFCIEFESGGISVKQTVNQSSYYFKEYSLNDSYRYAVCALTPYFEDGIRLIEPESFLNNWTSI